MVANSSIYEHLGETKYGNQPGVREAGDGVDAVADQVEYHDSIATVDSVGCLEVGEQGRLAIGSRLSET